MFDIFIPGQQRILSTENCRHFNNLHELYMNQNELGYRYKVYIYMFISDIQFPKMETNSI
jgi:hypothetical protein